MLVDFEIAVDIDGWTGKSTNEFFCEQVVVAARACQSEGAGADIATTWEAVGVGPWVAPLEALPAVAWAWCSVVGAEV